MKLSILVCSTDTRYKTFLPRMLDNLFAQWNKLPEDDKNLIEILSLIDNKQMTLGAKRNHMIQIARGNYIVFVDDDDRVTPNYISSLLKATEYGTDVITFTVSVSIDRKPAKPCFYSSDYPGNYNEPDSYHRLPNQICCVKRELAVLTGFSDITYGEDTDYAMRLKPLLKTQHTINDILYYYDANLATSETRKAPPSPKLLCDVIILSNASTLPLKLMTQKAVDSCFRSERQGSFNILVGEQANLDYHHASTVRMNEQFHYNQFANQLASKGSAPWICISNNDVIFQRGWFSAMMRVNHPVMSPRSSHNPVTDRIRYPEKGTEVGKHFAGWCFVISRKVWEQIGGFDEDFSFYCADNAVVEQLISIGIESCIVPASIVEHLVGVTRKKLPPDAKEEMIIQQVKKFNRKYDRNVLDMGK